MSREQTSMDDLLSRRQVDERERSPDDPPSIAESSEPEAFEAREAFTDTDVQDQPQAREKPEPRSKSVKDDDDGGADSESRRMSGLPKWAYMRLQANNQKAEAAERRAAEMEARLKQLETQRQPVQGDDEEAEETWDQWTTKKVDSVAQQMERQNWEVRNNFGWKLALQQHGQELPTQAAAWANDRAKADQDFARRVFQAPDPVEYSITEFKRAQFEDEAAKYGWDLDKLAQARLGKQQNQQQPQPAAGDRSGAASQPQTETRMPSDFASTGSGAGRVNGDTGPTPLSDLLSLNSRRR